MELKRKIKGKGNVKSKGKEKIKGKRADGREKKEKMNGWDGGRQRKGKAE